MWIARSFNAALRAGIGFVAVGERFVNPGNTVALPGYATVDAMMGNRIASIDLQLNVNNLLDRGYIVSGHGSAPNLNMPGAPRGARLTARYEF